MVWQPKQKSTCQFVITNSFHYLPTVIHLMCISNSLIISTSPQINKIIIIKIKINPRSNFFLPILPFLSTHLFYPPYTSRGVRTTCFDPKHRVKTKNVKVKIKFQPIKTWHVIKLSWMEPTRSLLNSLSLFISSKTLISPLSLFIIVYPPLTQ